MSPFKFKLEQVLRYRKQLEEEAMQALAEAVERRDRTRKRIKEIGQELIEIRLKLQNFAYMDAGERYINANYETALQEERKMALKILLKQDMEVDEKRQELIAKSKDRSLLDKLKEKQAQRHAREELLNEQKQYDETATLRYKASPF